MLRPPGTVSPSASLSELFTPPPPPPADAQSQPLRSTSPYHSYARRRSPQAHQVPLPGSPGLKGRAYSPSPLSRGEFGGARGEGIVRSGSPLIRRVSEDSDGGGGDAADEGKEEVVDVDDGGLNARALEALVADAGKISDDDDEDKKGGDRGKEDNEGLKINETISGKPLSSPRSTRSQRSDVESSKALHRSASIRSAKDISSLPGSPKASPPLPPPPAGMSDPTTPTRTSTGSVGKAGRHDTLSPTPSTKSGGQRSHRSIASTASAASTVVSDTNSTISPASSHEGSPIREGPKLSLKNRRRLRRRKEATDENHALYSMNPTSGLHILSSTTDLPQLQRVESFSGASTRTNRSVSSAFSSVSKKSISLPTLPWQRKEKGERYQQLEDSGFFERTTLPPKKVTRLPVLTIASIDTAKAQAGGAAQRGSVLLTPNAFYDSKRQSMRFSWMVQPDESEESTKRDVWIPAARFSWAVREKEGIFDPVKDKRISKLARLSALPPVTESDPTEKRANEEDRAEERGTEGLLSPKKMRWSLYAGSAPTTPKDSSEDKSFDHDPDDSSHAETDGVEAGTQTPNRRSWVLSTGSPSSSPKEVRVLAAIPDEDHVAADENDAASSSCEGWPLKILAAYDVPERAEVLAVIAEEDEEEEAELKGEENDDEVKDKNESWPMMVLSPGLPRMKVVGMASIDEEVAIGEVETPEEVDDAETSESLPSPELCEIAPLRSQNGSKRSSEESEEGGQVVALTPYQHGPIRMKRPEDVFRKGSLVGLNLGAWDEDSSIETWEKTEADLVESILDFFSGMLGTSEAACGAVEDNNNEAELADWQYLSAPLLDDALIREHAHGIGAEKEKKQKARRPPPLPPLPPPPPAMPDLPPAPPLPPTPPTPPQPQRPDSMGLHRPLMARAKSSKAKGVHSPSFSSLILRRNIF